jgi:uncharacterized protein YjeT (DUF2065 family)
MEKSIAIMAIINLLIMGLSHWLQPQAWREFFVLLSSKGNVGAFANGFLTLVMGSLIVSFHNVWTGLPVILTLLGWAYVVKSTVIFLYPQWNIRSMAGVEHAPVMKFRVAGFCLLSIAAALVICIATDGYSPVVDS